MQFFESAVLIRYVIKLRFGNNLGILTSLLCFNPICIVII
jgi:hypothetical protein